MHITNKSGLITDVCVTPLNTSFQLENNLLNTVTLCLLPTLYSVIRGFEFRPTPNWILFLSYLKLWM